MKESSWNQPESGLFKKCLELKGYIISVLQNCHQIWQKHQRLFSSVESICWTSSGKLHYTPQRPLEFQAVPFVCWVCFCCGPIVFCILNSQEDHERHKESQI